MGLAWLDGLQPWLSGIARRLLHRLLDLGRESETVGLSSHALTHYTLKNLGTRRLALESERIRAEIKTILLGPGRLYELLRASHGRARGRRPSRARALECGPSGAARRLSNGMP